MWSLPQLAAASEAIADWIARADQLVPHEDRKLLLSPPRLLAAFTRFALRHAVGVDRKCAIDVGARDPELLTLLGELWRALAKYYFRFRAEGVENVPPSGPVLLVGNHCGGLLPSEGFLTALAVNSHLGLDRAIFALAHDFLFDDPTLRRYAARLGMLPAGHASAHAAFAAGGCVLVYPGSDMDTFRTFRQRGRIELAGRTGFIALALRERVPIVPIVDAGTHEQMIVLWRGDRIARLVRAHAWARTNVLPLVLSLPWGLTSGYLPYLPLPAQTTLSFLPAIRWPELGPDAAERPEVLARCYAEVEHAMQAELDRLSEGRRFLLGQRVTPPRPAAASTSPGTPPARDPGGSERGATRRSIAP